MTITIVSLLDQVLNINLPTYTDNLLFYINIKVIKLIASMVNQIIEMSVSLVIKEVVCLN